MADEDLEPTQSGQMQLTDPDPSSETFPPPESSDLPQQAVSSSQTAQMPSSSTAAAAPPPASAAAPAEQSPPMLDVTPIDLPRASTAPLPQSKYTMGSLSTPPTKAPMRAVSPLQHSISTPMPGDLVEIDAKDLGRSEFLKDSGARLREQKVPDKQLKQEETAESAWRKLLSNLATTDFVHVRILRRQPNGSYLPLGSRYNMSADEIRGIDKLIPYSGKWVIAVAHASNRADNESAYRKFTYERGGPEMPEGWSFDGIDLEQELDMATANELINELMRRQQAGQIPTPQQQTVTPFPQGGSPWGGMPPYGYPPYFPAPGYGMPPWGSAPDDHRREAEEERRRREEDERRRREDDERRRREDEARERREYEEKRDRERREEREKLEAERKVSEDRHRQEMDALRKMAEDNRLLAEKTSREWQDRYAQEQQRWRDDRDRLEREKVDAAHRAELGGLVGIVDSLKKEIGDLRTSGTLTAKSGTDWTALANSLVPLVTGYLATEREARSDERRARLEDTARERDRASRDAEQMTKLVSMLGDSQINSAKVAGDLIQRMQDPSALMNLTRLVSETLGGNVQLVAQLVKSGIAGGGGGHSGIDWGSLLGQGLETLGGIASSFADMKQEQLRMMGQQPLAGPQPGFAGAMPQQPQAMPPQAGPVRMPQQPQQPQQPQGAAKGTPLLRGMVETIRDAIANEHDPKEVAGMIDALVYSAQKYKVDKADPKSAAFIQSIQSDPEKTLRAAFPKARPEYIRLIAQALMGGGEENEPEEDAAKTDGSGNGKSEAASQTSAPEPETESKVEHEMPAPTAKADPVVALPSRRGRGRPRGTSHEPPPQETPPTPEAG